MSDLLFADRDSIYSDKRNGAFPRPIKKRGGPPRKYQALVSRLVDDHLYTPGMIAKLMPQDDMSQRDREKAITRIRITLSRFLNKHMPDDGDGQVNGYRAYYGQTWKAYYLE